MIPCCRIDSTSSCSASRPKSFRGCSALGITLAKLIWCTLSPASPPSLGVATLGVLISAPRPLRKPERAMRLRLPGQTDQSNSDVILSGTRGFVVATSADSSHPADRIARAGVLVLEMEMHWTEEEDGERGREREFA